MIFTKQLVHEKKKLTFCTNYRHEQEHKKTGWVILILQWYITKRADIILGVHGVTIIIVLI